MEIFWLGHGCFRLRGRDATVVTDPCPPTTGYRVSKLAADIVTISRDQPDSSYRAALTGEPQYLAGPGEYEIAGVLINGVRTDHDSAHERGQRNVAYMMDLDDIRICHLGSLSRRPTSDEIEVLGNVDVLLLPVGGGGALDAESAAETVNLLEPKLVVPMRYKTDVATDALEPVERFLKEIGAEGKQPEARLVVTRSNLPADTTVVLLNYRT